jgi:formylglycine-generating enzyme required for sulfatase activity
MRRTFVLTVLAVALAAASALAADPAYYKKAGTWQETLRQSREALAAQEAAAKPDAAGKPAAVTLGPWQQIGPFLPPSGSGFGFAFPPEKEIDLAKTYDSLRWQAQAGYTDGQVQELSAPGNASTYLYRVITSPAAQNITLFFGSDDGMRAWLNGKEFLTRDVPRVASPNQDKATLTLQAGENRLLLKIYNRSGGHGFYFSASDKPTQSDPRLVAREALWDLVVRDFDAPDARRQIAWEKADGLWSRDWTPGDWADLAGRYVGATRMPRQTEDARRLASAAKDAAGVQKVRDVYYRARELEDVVARGGDVDVQALGRAIADLIATFGDRYPKGREFATRLETLLASMAAAQQAKDGEKSLALSKDLLALQREALTANPLLDFERLLYVRRADKGNLGLPQNWQGNSSVGRKGYDNRMDVVAMKDPGGPVRTLYTPEDGRYVGDIEPHWDGKRLLFSMPGENDRWQVWEIGTDGKGLRQVTSGEQKDIDNYDGCYLPGGRIIFCSTAGYLGVPCVSGSDHVGALYIADAQGKNVRQLTFDQDHAWCPTVLPTGRVLYTRWEYSDTPHYFTRILFEMNPDGTSQFEHYGSNSYWPNSMFYARPVPGHATKVATIVSGHHGVPRMGELVILDPAQGRHEASGVVQRIPGHGKKVEPVIKDQLVNDSWPRFLHPWPLSEKYLLVSCKKSAQTPWALYLVDVFDNMLCLREEPGYALLEPVPVQERPAPPVIPDKVDPARKDATVYLVDVYTGGGMKDVPRGTVKAMRVYTNHNGYRGMGGHINIGIDGPWDARRILGTVPVYEDGSAMFTAPANMPLVVQPVDAEGRAVQVMRSWYTAMPGEFASCVGCHERQSERPTARLTQATSRGPTPIAPWYGPARPFAFEREVQQPVLEKYCVGCHDGQPRHGRALPDFRAQDKVAGYKGHFTPAYEALHPYVRRPGPESDYHLPNPMEYFADVSELVQMLKKGHHGVKLDAEAWDRLYTWMDLNVPCHGTWSEHRKIAGEGRQRRIELARLYAGLDLDPEAYPEMPARPVAFIKPQEPPKPVQAVRCDGWPFDAAEAQRRQAAGGTVQRSVDLDDGVKLDLVYVPAGQFVMGDAAGAPDERALSVVRIAKPFWMGRLEVSNAQFAAFDPSHTSSYISVYNKDQDNRGQAADRPTQPVIRVSWKQAAAFCQWLSEKTGERFTLPTEAQWEYACRAGTATPMSYGAVDADFSKLANLADERVGNLTRRDSPRWIPSLAQFNDGAVITENVGKYQPNAWGLHDMHGNVAEWTLSAYRPYPYVADDGRDAPAADGLKVVRGGSFYDRPLRATSAFRWGHQPWQRVFNVGFRVVSEVGAASQVATKQP